MSTNARDVDPATPILPEVRDPEAAAKAAASAGHTQDPDLPDPKHAEEYEFEIDVSDGSGKQWRGTFKNKILTIAQRQNVGLTMANMTGNVPWFAIDEETQGLLIAVSHLTHSLISKPSWFKLYGDDAIRNIRILNAVYGEVTLHEATFRGSIPPTT